MNRTVIRSLTVTLVLLGFALPSTAQNEPPDFDITPAERAEVIEGALEKLNQTYVFPDTAREMEKAVRSRAKKGEYDRITTGRELARKLTADLRELSRDKHLTVNAFAQGVPDISATPSAERQAEQREHMSKVNFGFEKVERLDGNVGYIEIRGFVPAHLGAETASAAMNFIANSDALIVDLRRNGGGEPAMIAYVLSYLFDEPTHLNDIWERVGDQTQQYWTLPHVPGPRFGGEKPVYVLTSNRTFSGGEEFAYNLRNLERATLIGETTGGGAHPVRPVKINDRFAIGVPFARAISPVTKTNWEGTGVQPHIAIPAEQALDRAYVLALEKVLEKESNPRRRQQIEKLLAEKKTS